MKRRFTARGSLDKGITWRKANATGWPITNAKEDGVQGYVVSIDMGDIFIDVKIPEKILRLILRDITNKQLFDDGEDDE